MGGDSCGLDDVGLNGEDGEAGRRSDEGEGGDETSADDEFLKGKREGKVSASRRREE